MCHLLEEFHAWQAVWLLTLPHLPPVLQRTLESGVRRQPALIDSQYRLYPATVDPRVVNAARVEATLRRSLHDPDKGRPEEPVPDYPDFADDRSR